MRPATARPNAIVAARIPGVDNGALLCDLEARGVTFGGRSNRPRSWTQTLLGCLPFLALLGFYWYRMQRTMHRGGGPLNVGHSQPTIHDRNAAQRASRTTSAGTRWWRSRSRAAPGHPVTIIRRSIRALGASSQLPTDDHFLLTREEPVDRITAMLGGRSATVRQKSWPDEATGPEEPSSRLAARSSPAGIRA